MEHRDEKDERPNKRTRHTINSDINNSSSEKNINSNNNENNQEKTQISNILPSSESVVSAEEARTKQMQADIAARMMSFKSLIDKQQEKKAQYRPLLLDSLGREIDEKGNLVRKVEQIKTLTANIGQAQKKKENPYLSHRGGASKGTEQPETNSDLPILDDRIKVANRDFRAKKAFNFVEAGTYVKHADQQRFKEERKIIAGYTSGRRAPDIADEESNGENLTDKHSIGTKVIIDENVSINGEDFNSENALKIFVPPPPDNGVVPCMEWWDEAFLPKSLREARKRSRAKQEEDDFEQLSFFNCKTCKYIQHPIPVKPLAGDRPEEPLKLFLTKKERKRIRRTAREEREREKRDKMLMGLIPTPEPKFKLSNFMKILGDQAISDPSKVEKRVIQQMQQRRLNHEMRNLARKLTPAEKKEKKRKKLLEDTSKQVHIALFRVKDFSDAKHRFKVDVNVQQLNISGTALLCPSTETNLVVAEGGPKGIKKIIKLMTKRVNWTQKSESVLKKNGVPGNNSFGYYGEQKHIPDEDNSEKNPNSIEINENSNQIEENDPNSKNENENDDNKNNDDNNNNNDDDDEDDDDNDEDDNDNDNSGDILASNNSCELLWQGIVPRRLFHGFRFQECRTSTTARKVLEAKGVAHYWDMAVRADRLSNTNNI